MKPKSQYAQLQVNTKQAEEIALDLYGITGEVTPLPGELDFNFRIKTNTGSFILKISRPDVFDDFIDFQQNILIHLQLSMPKITSPQIIPDIHGNGTGTISDYQGKERKVRLLTWIDGRLWSGVNPQKTELLFSLGEQAGKITKALHGFDHPYAHREFEWDLSQAEWTIQHTDLFDGDNKTIVQFFQERFINNLPKIKSQRHGVVHNDANDNNVVVSDDLINPEVISIIDYGDAIHTAIINDLAITIAYAVMNKPDVLSAALPVVRAYHKSFPLLEEELELLYTLIVMRLVISVTKSAINKLKEPDNQYLLVSEKPAWEVLKKWYQTSEQIACYSFRDACGFTAHPNENVFNIWAKQNSFGLNELSPSLSCKSATRVDVGLASTWLGNKADYSDPEFISYKINKIKLENPDTLIAGGYTEIRPFYSTDAFRKEGNNGPEYRTAHLGIDFWMDADTPVHTPFDGKVFAIHNNDFEKDYGPTIILEHAFDQNKKFYSLYGHLSLSTLKILKKGQHVMKGQHIAYIGKPTENGNWPSHLHFQLMLDMLGNTTDFPGVAFPGELPVWKSICPDPNLFLNEEQLKPAYLSNGAEVIEYRRKHLGKSLSLSYNKPLKIVRGDGAFLIDNTGRKYLDTVNNVAHVGHEHPRVVKAGQNQMAILNTNTRYLHENINAFAKALLATFPDELSVVHFVNSGSEANELALRMAKTCTNQKDMIAVEVGYHGNTVGCVDISSYKFDGKGGKGAPEHTHIVPLPDAFRGRYQGDNTGELYASHIPEKIAEIQAKGRNVAAFICESIISCGGQIELPETYLEIAYAAIRQAGGLCIADEVQVGCGRVGSAFWGFQLHNVIPDIVTIGKPIGNGHPLAAVVCTQAVADIFANGMEYFNTFGGNPVSCAIGSEVLQIIKDEKLQEHALIVGTYLKYELLNMKNEFPVIGNVRGKGLFLGFELNDKKKYPLGEKAEYLANRMKELGILMSTDGPDHNVLKIKPPMVFSMENADELILRLRKVFCEDFMQLGHE